MVGGRGVDVIMGGLGNDILKGNDGRDSLRGHDTLQTLDGISDDFGLAGKRTGNLRFRSAVSLSRAWKN
jgi:Ca2+-binding RTX toxin-like protein